MSLNINRSVCDPFCRYKMPPIETKYEGKGNGIKTLIVNMDEICKLLGRLPSHVTKYFSVELGTQTQVNPFIVRGFNDAVILQCLLDGYIKKFVLCPICSNPETILKVRIKPIPHVYHVYQTCKACGHRVKLDTAHKLRKYIIRQEPKEMKKRKQVDFVFPESSQHTILHGRSDDVSVAAVEQRKGELSKHVRSLLL